MRKINIDKYKIIIKIITIFKDYFMVLEKAVLGIISHSSFMWINALYSDVYLWEKGYLIHH